MGPLDPKQLMKVLYSIDKSLGRIATALEKQYEEFFVVNQYTELDPIENQKRPTEE